MLRRNMVGRFTEEVQVISDSSSTVRSEYTNTTPSCFDGRATQDDSEAFMRWSTQTLQLSLTNDSAATKRREIHDSFNCTFTLYENLFLMNVSEEGHFMRADPLRHPLIFYLGHTAAFFVNKLALARIIGHKDRPDPNIESLVSVGVDEMSWDDLMPIQPAWPLLQQMMEYRLKVRTLVSSVIQGETHIALLDSDNQIDWNHPMWVILMGIEHERIHLETSSVLIRQLPLQALNVRLEKKNIFKLNECPHWNNNYSSAAKMENKMIRVLGGVVNLGRSRKNDPQIYGWDNEFGHYEEHVNDFYASEKLISNAEYCRFIAAGGYNERKYWSREGWEWLQFSKATKPRFWTEVDKSIKQKPRNGTQAIEPAFVQRNMLSETESMPWNWPAEVNCLEASAFCRWLAYETGVDTCLPTEVQYARLRELAVPNEANGTAKLSHNTPNPNANLSLQHFSTSAPVDMFKQGAFYDVVGNVWQWTRTPIFPFQGSEVHPLYDDFSMPTYDDKHNLIKGGSWISCGNEVTKFSRYGFRRHFYQHAGFRIVQQTGQRCSHPPICCECHYYDFDAMNSSSLQQADEGANVYESDALLSQYCEFHFGPLSPLPGIENFPVAVARICEMVAKIFLTSNPKTSPLRALDLGCAVGRTSFELARIFDEVIGVDFSARFIQAGCSLQKAKLLRYSIAAEGEIKQHREIALGGEKIPLRGLEGWKIIEHIVGPRIVNCLRPLDVSSAALPEDEVNKNLEDVCKRVRFYQGDACNLSQSNRVLTAPFDLVVAANLLDRLYDPQKFLDDIPNRIVSGGFLVILSPYTWLEEFTPKEKWIGGKKVNGENKCTEEGLDEILSSKFKRISITELRSAAKAKFGLGDDEEKKPSKMKSDNRCSFNSTEDSVKDSELFDTTDSFHIPFVIRETKRKYQLVYSHCTIWQKM